VEREHAAKAGEVGEEEQVEFERAQATGEWFVERELREVHLDERESERERR